ncbi:hypothetical protein EVAR_97745_1 [Eumeta japonica]|uniref:Uncharacterized protein n=1 Tax=Eumeta variegata TaxID=151549 RepID=A0A4C1X7V2_EUMVA|nr:hypothetical protein EVAR_97745_1 [Eumeta japonica]
MGDFQGLKMEPEDRNRFDLDNKATDHKILRSALELIAAPVVDSVLPRFSGRTSYKSKSVRRAESSAGTGAELENATGVQTECRTDKRPKLSGRRVSPDLSVDERVVPPSCVKLEAAP